MPKVSIEIGANDTATAILKKVNQQLEDLGRTGNKTQGVLSTMGNILGKFKFLLPTIGVAAAFKLGNDAMGAWKVQQAAIANVEAGLRSTKEAAGLTSLELQKMAKESQKIGLFADQDILHNATAQLLTFGNIGYKNFERVQKAAMDVTAKLHGVEASGDSLKNVSIMMGKAMEDPIRGMNAMRRVGISFSESEIQQVQALLKVNDTLGAQTVMLEGIERQYGGTNEALAKTSAGMAKIKAHKMEEAMEKLGKSLIPVKAGLMDIATEIIKAFTPMSDEEDWTKGQEYMLKMQEEYIKLVEQGREKEAEKIAEELKGGEQARKIMIPFNTTAKERLEIYKQLAKLSKEEAQAKYLVGTNEEERTEIEKKRLLKEQNDAATKGKKREYTEEEKKQYAERVKEAQKYFSDMKFKQDMALANDEERIELQTAKEYEEIEKRKAYLGEYYKEAQKLIEAHNTGEHEKLRQQRTADMFKAMSEMEVDFYQNSVSASANAVGEMSKAIADSMKKLSGTIGDTLEQATKDSRKAGLNFGDSFKIGAAVATAALEAVSAVLAMQNKIAQASYQRQIDALEAKKNKELELLEESYEALEEDTANTEELRLAKLQAYADSLKGMTDSDIQYALKKKEAELKSAADEKTIDKKKAAEKKKIEDAYAMQEWKLEVEAFKQQQDYDKSAVKMSVALGVVNAWSSAMKLPWPLNTVIGGVLTGIMVGAGKKQLSLIDSQKPPAPPALEKGTRDFEGGWALVGEKGPELTYIPKGADVYSNKESKSMIQSGPQYVVNNIYLDSVLISQSLVNLRKASAYGGY